MSYPPPPPPPGTPGPGGDPGAQPTQAFPPGAGQPPYGTPAPGYAPPGGTPAPGYGPPTGGGYPPQPGYTPAQPPKKGMSSGAIIGIAAVVLVAVLLAGVGVFLVTRGDDDDDRADDDRTEQTTEDDGGDDTTTTTEDDGTTTTTEDDGTTTTTEGTSGTSEGGGDLAMGGETSASGYVDGDESAFYTVTVPQGESAVLTLTPDSEADIVLVVDGTRYDDGLSGEPERVTLTGGTIPFEIEIYEFWGNGAGYYLELS